MKNKSVFYAAALVLTLISGCSGQISDNEHSGNSQTTPIAENGFISDDKISYTKDMDGYSINVSVCIHKSDEVEGLYDIDLNDRNVFVADTSGNVLSSAVLNNPSIGGLHHRLHDLNIKFDVITMESGNLFAVRFPSVLGSEPSAYSLTLYYFDSEFVNYIGKMEGGGDFFPTILGDIQIDGDDFTLNEVDDEGNSSEVTYSVDFDKKVLAVKQE